MKQKWTPFFLLLPFLGIIGVILVSVGNVLVQSLGYIPAFGLTRFTLDYYRQIFAREDFVSALQVSLRLALWSASLACVLGVIIATALVRLKKTGGGVLSVIRLPILTPHAVVAVFMVQLLGQTGLLARVCYSLGWIQDFSQFPQLLYTAGQEGTILAYLWKEAPFVAYFVLAYLAGISDTLGQAAENLGASPLRAFFLVTLPLSLPVIGKAFLILFIFAFGGYELPLLLGSTLPKALPVQAYLSYMEPNLRARPAAMAMNSVILLLSLAMALAYWAAMHALAKKVGGIR